MKGANLLRKFYTTFEKISGLQINPGKTVLLAHKPEKYNLPFTKKPINNPDVYYLGVPLSIKLKNDFIKNWKTCARNSIMIDLPILQRVTGINT